MDIMDLNVNKNEMHWNFQIGQYGIRAKIHDPVTFCQNSQSYGQIPVIQESKRIAIKETNAPLYQTLLSICFMSILAMSANDINSNIVNNKYTIINLNTMSLQFIVFIGINQYSLNKFYKLYLQFFESFINFNYNKYYNINTFNIFRTNNIITANNKTNKFRTILHLKAIYIILDTKYKHNDNMFSDNLISVMPIWNRITNLVQNHHIFNLATQLELRILLHVFDKYGNITKSIKYKWITYDYDEKDDNFILKSMKR